jgi:hypothetical protein
MRAAARATAMGEGLRSSFNALLLRARKPKSRTQVAVRKVTDLFRGGGKRGWTALWRRPRRSRFRWLWLPAAGLAALVLGGAALKLRPWAVAARTSPPAAAAVVAIPAGARIVPLPAHRPPERLAGPASGRRHGPRRAAAATRSAAE